MSAPQHLSLCCSTFSEVWDEARPGHGSPVDSTATLTRLLRAMLWLSLLVTAVPAQAQFSEHEVKAALLLNFARFVTWPAEAFDSADAPLVIGILDDGTMAAQIEKVAKGQRAGNRSIIVQRFDSASGVKRCQILFVGKNFAAQLDALSARACSSCLTVSDTEDFLRRGGTIRFFFSIDNKVRFEINPRAVSRQRLKPSASLLRLARTASDGR